MASHDLLSTWLKDAHSMEKAIAEFAGHIHKHHGDRADLRDALQEVIDKCNEHEASVKTLLSDDDSEVSGGKDLIGRLTSFISGAGSNLFHDDDVKDILVLHAVLHFAHACYVSLAHGAKARGEEEIATESERLAGEKEALAQRVLDLVPVVTVIALDAQQ